MYVRMYVYRYEYLHLHIRSLSMLLCNSHFEGAGNIFYATHDSINNYMRKWLKTSVRVYV